MRYQGLLNGLFLALAATSVRADEIVHFQDFLAIQPGDSRSATLPQFDPSLGVLRYVELRFATSLNGVVGLENTSGSSVVLGGWAGTIFAIMYLPWSVAGSAGAVANPSYAPPMTTLSAYDGVTDYAGNSGELFAFMESTGDGNPAPEFARFLDQDLAPYVGTGTVAISVGPTWENVLGGFQLPPGVVATKDVSAQTRLFVTYTYDPFPAAICRAMNFSGCPCSDGSSSFGGCDNSVNASGGALASSGEARITSDTLVLSGSGMTNSNALYYQGTTFSYVSSVYGDGLRCVAGSIVRLGTRTNASGASSVPSPGGTPVSAVGGVVAPGQRFYQVVYRDVGSFCTPSTFNTTNGIAILWSL